MPEGLEEDQWAAAGYGIGLGLARALLRGDFELGLLGRVRTKTFVITAAKDDDIEETLSMGAELREANKERRAAKIEWMKHVWSLQDGELFAKSVKVWLKMGRRLTSLRCCDCVTASPGFDDRLLPLTGHKDSKSRIKVTVGSSVVHFRNSLLNSFNLLSKRSLASSMLQAICSCSPPVSSQS